MTKITQEKFLEMIKGDKEMAKRLADYLGGETDVKIVAQKTAEFAKKEGYEIELKQSLETSDLANVSGGAADFNTVAQGISLGINALAELTKVGLVVTQGVMDLKNGGAKQS